MNVPEKDFFYSDKEALIRISSFCSYQERTQQEVREKLYGYGLKKDSVEEIIVKLIQENFINEERFAKTYAGGKFRIKQWGRLKITNALRQKGISEYCISQGLKEINDQDYRQTLSSLLDKRLEKEKEPNEYKRIYKTAQYAVSRGYEPDLVWQYLKSDASF